MLASMEERNLGIRREKVPDSMIKLPDFGYEHSQREEFLVGFRLMIKSIDGEYLLTNELRRMSDGMRVDGQRPPQNTTTSTSVFSPTQARRREAYAMVGDDPYAQAGDSRRSPPHSGGTASAPRSHVGLHGAPVQTPYIIHSGISVPHRPALPPHPSDPPDGSHPPQGADPHASVDPNSGLNMLSLASVAPGNMRNLASVARSRTYIPDQPSEAEWDDAASEAPSDVSSVPSVHDRTQDGDRNGPVHPQQGPHPMHDATASAMADSHAYENEQLRRQLAAQQHAHSDQMIRLEHMMSQMQNAWEK